jgi:hypothetical protein
MDNYLKKIVEEKGCYFRERDTKFPFGYFAKRKGLASKLMAPIDYLRTEPLLFRDFEVLFPPEMEASDSILNSELAINAKKGLTLELAIAELEKQDKSLRLINLKKDIGYGITKVVEGLVYSPNIHAEPSYDIFCGHYSQSDIRFHWHSFVRENKCHSCSPEEEYAKSIKLIGMSINLLEKIKQIQDGTYKAFDLEALAARHN